MPDVQISNEIVQMILDYTIPALAGLFLLKQGQ